MTLTTEYKIRTATLSDLEQITEIEATCFPLAEAASGKSFQERLTVYANHFWLLYDGEKIISFVNGMVTDAPDLADEMYEDASLHNEEGKWQMIFGVDTLPEYQRKGCAEKLLRHVIAEAKSQGREGLVLTCKDKLVSFYAKFGFVQEGISESVHGGAVWYQMRLCFAQERQILRIQEHPELVADAARWFHQKWGVPEEAYLESMQECLEKTFAVPQWYLVKDDEKIIAGIGVIENDFHDRKDLTPNVCAVYVEEAYRKQGIAGEMLQFVCREFAQKGIGTLYLITDHTSFYERYGWKFLCMVQGDGEPDLSRMYIHRTIVQKKKNEPERGSI